ncbi:hypothetical protein CPB86DRAFT_751770 [Serendipita vermifera]|nr:hypothetical protein CPB86DRAFT_751770 [Serendipita vermifera]
MSLRLFVNQNALVRCAVRARYIHISQRNLAAYHNEKEPYDPEADQTPRRKYIFGGALLIAATAAVLSSTSKKVKAEAHDSDYKKDPATDVEFPTSLELPGTPPLTLLGLGVRTVSFLGLKVYSVGFYADLNQPGFALTETGTPDEQIEHVVRNTTCALRIVPVRSTSHTHLRDGFIRAIQARVTLARQSGYLTPEEEDALNQPIQVMKGLFPNVSLPKHKPLHAVLTAPNAINGSRTLYFPELGRVENAWVANEFFLSYFSGKGISPPMKKSVEDAIAHIGGWRTSTGKD